MHVCIQLLTRFDLKSLPSVATVTLPNLIRVNISRTNLSQKQKCFYQMLIESEKEGECRNQSKNGKAKEWVIIAYSFYYYYSLEFFYFGG